MRDVFINGESCATTNSFPWIEFCEEELTARVGGWHWRVHKTDKAKWASDPHAIDENGRKLDLTNGDIYCSITGKYVRKLTKKELKAVKAELKIAE